MNLIQILGAIEIGLIYGLVGIAVYLSFRVLQFPDLTVDSSFPLGGLVCAALIVYDFHPYLALCISFFCGACAGFITAWLATRLKILNLLAGILTMTGLYSVNLRIMGTPNIAISSDKKTIFTIFYNEQYNFVLLFIFVVTIVAIIYWFLSTKLGLALRASGHNAKMARANGINDNQMIWLGLGLSNGLVALAGALFAQLSGAGDANSGLGTIVYGLAAVILGKSILPTRTVLQALVACVCGAIVHRYVHSLAFYGGDLGLVASDTPLITALLVVLVSVMPELKKYINNLKVNAK